MTSGALERVIRGAGVRRAEAAEHCDMCSLAVPDRHRHVLNTENGQVMCVCQACSLLFVKEAASEGHYRLIPERRIRLGDFSTEGLGVPVGLAYFVRHGDGAVVAHYPSPMGATQWEVDEDAWRDVVEQCAPLREMEADVEALLVNTARGQQHRWLVPIDECFRLVALVRKEWTGLSGGSRVWPAIDEFFAELTEQRR